MVGGVIGLAAVSIGLGYLYRMKMFGRSLIWKRNETFHVFFLFRGAKTSSAMVKPMNTTRKVTITPINGNSSSSMEDIVNEALSNEVNHPRPPSNTVAPTSVTDVGARPPDETINLGSRFYRIHQIN